MNVKILSVLFVVAFFASTTTFAGDKYEKPKPMATAEANAKAVAKATAYGGDVTVDNHIQNVNKIDIDIKNVIAPKIGVTVNPTIEGSSATANIGDIKNIAIGGEGGRADANVTIEDGAIRTGDQTVTVNDGDVSLTTGDVNVSTGDVSLSTGDVNVSPVQNIVIEASKLPNTPYVDTVNTELAYLINKTMTLEEINVEFAQAYFENCPREFRKSAVPEVRKKRIKNDGRWYTNIPIITRPFKKDKIKVRFVPHPSSYRENLGNLSGLPDIVKFDEHPSAGLLVRCMGLITARATSSSEVVSVDELDSETGFAAADFFEGFGVIYLVSNTSVIATPQGVSSESGAFGIGSGLARTFSQMVGTGTTSGAINRATTRPIAFPARTYAVYAADNNGFPFPEEDEEVSETPPGDEVDKSLEPDPASPSVADKTILDRDPNDFGPRQIKYVNP